MPGLSLSPQSEGFLLRRETAEGIHDSLLLTALDVLTLADLAPSLRQQAMDQIRISTGSSSPELAETAIPVTDFDISEEMLGEHLILLLRLGSHTAAFALPLKMAEQLSSVIQQHLQDQSPLSRQ
jgi:hypothetical protein